MPRVSVNIDVKRYVTEYWEFDLKPGETPEQVFDELKADPDLLWTRFNSNLTYAEDMDEFVTDVVSIEVINDHLNSK